MDRSLPLATNVSAVARAVARETDGHPSTLRIPRAMTRFPSAFRSTHEGTLRDEVHLVVPDLPDFALSAHLPGPPPIEAYAQCLLERLGPPAVAPLRRPI